jgi:hypothetical protein
MDSLCWRRSPSAVDHHDTGVGRLDQSLKAKVVMTGMASDEAKSMFARRWRHPTAAPCCRQRGSARAPRTGRTPRSRSGHGSTALQKRSWLSTASSAPVAASHSRAASTSTRGHRGHGSARRVQRRWRHPTAAPHPLRPAAIADKA